MNHLSLSLAAGGVLFCALTVAACGGGSGSAASGSGGAQTTPGTGGAVPGAGGGSGGMAAGDAAGGGGTTSPVDTSGSGGAADAGGGASDAAAGDGPTDGALADAASTRFVCPAGNFEAPKAGTPRVVCAGVVRYNWNEGPAWVPSQKAFFFSNFPIGTYQTGDMIKYTPSTGLCEIYIQGARCNGLMASNDGGVLAACQGTRAVMKFDLTTKQATVVASMAEGKMLDSVNDLVQHSNGSIYFSNPTFELAGRPVGLGSAVLRIDPAGAVSVIARGGVNGVALSPDEKRLYVVQQGVWDLDAQGVPSNKRDFALGSDGIAVDCAGNIYDNGGIITSPAGQRIGTFPAGTNMAFGGPDGKTMLVVGNQTAQVVEMNVPGPP